MKKRRHQQARRRPGRVGQVHGRTWTTMEWYLPFIDDKAIIYHGHTDPDDHSECGPQVFCCPKAALLLLQRYPNSSCAQAEWAFTDGKHLASWMSESGPLIYYFLFCDPNDRSVLRFCGVRAPEVRNVLFKRAPLDDYLEVADCIVADGTKIGADRRLFGTSPEQEP